jgi:hypothetical protein
LGAAVPFRISTSADEVTLVTPEREQKPEQHLEIATPIRLSPSISAVALMLDTARRFTEAASGRLNMRLSCVDALASRHALNRNASDVLALGGCSATLDLTAAVSTNANIEATQARLSHASQRPTSGL